MFRNTMILLLLGIFYAMSTNAQQCIYTKLSKEHNFKISYILIKDTDLNNPFRTRKLTLTISNKKRKLIQQIKLNTNILYDDVFKKDTSSRSYITNFNTQADAPDYDYGDLIIADLNFDGKEDIALKFDSGGNGGPLYKFYLQNNRGTFDLSGYLTDYIGSFPANINSKNKTLTTQIHANVHQESRKTYKFNPQTKKWRLLKSVMIEA